MKFGVDPAEWRRVLDLANAGEISLSPEVAKGLDKICDDYLDRLDGIFRLLDSTNYVAGFGPFPSGKALEEKFSLKATGTDQSMDIVLKQHIDSVKLAKEVVAKAISNFTQQDQSRADQFTALDTQP
ncbi:hypothetical protein AB0B25_13815 [Nocardia sp. NPDC049190]|uniref:hypothetical protein n=1 Tax=Nocardia sp. NPDC049190 TaxID=3155650 RepID=UPI0033F4B016